MFSWKNSSGSCVGWWKCNQISYLQAPLQAGVEWSCIWLLSFTLSATAQRSVGGLLPSSAVSQVNELPALTRLLNVLDTAMLQNHSTQQYTPAQLRSQVRCWYGTITSGPSLWTQINLSNGFHFGLNCFQMSLCGPAGSYVWNNIRHSWIRLTPQNWFNISVSHT